MENISEQDIIKKRFLIVDDLVMNRILLGEILAIIGCNYTYANNGKEAIDKIEQADVDFDIVLMDIEMPVMNGIEATKIIKEDKTLASKLKILGITAHDPKQFSEDYSTVKFDGFVTKPYSLERIKCAIQSLY